MRVLLLGAGGLLGREMASRHPREHVVKATTRPELDIRDAHAVAAMMRDVRPDWVVNATAYNDVDGAERDQETAFAVNANAVRDLAVLCRENGAGILHFSTDYVFSGNSAGCYREDDEVGPINTYGASKLAGEQLVRGSGARHLIIRTQWVFGIGGRSFLSTLWDRALRGEKTRVVSDEFGCCTYVVDLARSAWGALGRLEGTYHVANRDRASRFELARRVFAAAGTADLVIPCESRTMPMVARRPSSSMLCVEKMEQALGYRFSSWTDAVDRYLGTLSGERRQA